MKTNFFKIVLPAFAFMLAIITSLAFTSNSNASEEVDVTVYIWDDTATPQVCTAITIDHILIPYCSTGNFGDVCTAAIENQNDNHKVLYSGPPCDSLQVLRKPL